VRGPASHESLKLARRALSMLSFVVVCELQYDSA
jgi:hypothetical protein